MKKLASLFCHYVSPTIADRVMTGAMTILLTLPVTAHAQTVTGGASPTTMVNNVCTFILGSFGQTIAVLGIIGIGFLFIFGRASLGVIAGIIGDVAMSAMPNDRANLHVGNSSPLNHPHPRTSRR